MSALFERLTGLTLLHPAWLLLLAAVPIAWLLRRRQGEAAMFFAPARLFRPGAGSASSEAGLPRSWRVRLMPLPRLLIVLGVLLAVVAMARPAKRALVPQEREGIDILLCLDTSSSMSADDMDRERTRLEVARDAAARFVEARPEDRIGLLAFARYPDVLCPLTLDHRALLEILRGVDTVGSDSPEDATGIGTAVAQAAAVLERGKAPSRVVILLTDGEENVAIAGTQGEIPPAHAAQLCEALGVRVYAIAAGVGRRDATGAFVPLDTAPVERLARRTGGSFHRARDASAVEAVYERIDALERTPLEEPRTVYLDRHPAFLVLGMILVLAGVLLGATVLEVLP